MKAPSTILLLLCCYLSVSAQKKSATVSGKIVDDNETPLQGVSVVILGRQSGVNTNDSGRFTIKVPAERAFALVFSYAGLRSEQKNFLLNEGEAETITVRMEKGVHTLEEVTVTDQRDRRETGLVRPNPKAILQMPAVNASVESMIKVFVGSNNELTSQYAVRGGNFDENLVYVNDFEVFRPYLIRNGQQEGLSFINPEMVSRINFYTGGFQARYGDKMSSVLDIQYKKPVKKFGGSAYLGILEQGLHVEGIGLKNKFSYLLGVRNRSNQNLLSRQETQGNYVPSSSDVQLMLNYAISDKTSTELFGNFSRSKFFLRPEFSQLSAAVFSPYFTANLGLDIYFEGQEKDEYTTAMLGAAITQQVNSRLKLKWMASQFNNDESEQADIAGLYLFGERNFDKGSNDFGMIANPLGAGINHNYLRNELNIHNFNVAHKGSYDHGKHALLWGLSYDHTQITDKLHEWEYQDSAGYSLPYDPAQVQLSKYLHSSAELSIHKYSAYIQDNLLFKSGSSVITFSGGLRANYNSLNEEILISPRLGASLKPAWKKPARPGHSGGDIIFRIAGGAYHQPPFYRELRRYDGTVNTKVKAQKSWQGIAGFDYNFSGWGRPMRWTTEAYYKNITDVVPYDIDNVRIRYYGENNAKAMAAGIEMRLYGELVKDAESWVSIAFAKTREDIFGDTYKEYTLDDEGLPIDSTTVEKGWVRRPTDRRITFGMFFQDYLSTNKNFRMHLYLLYGSNLPYNIPNNVKYRNGLEIPAYLRADIGFSALLLDSDRSRRRSHNPFRGFDDIWASLEVFNLIDRDNTISYLLVKDFSNTTFTMPQRLTPRLLNFKIVARW